MSSQPHNHHRLAAALLALLLGGIAPAAFATAITGTVVGIHAGGNINMQILNSSAYATPTQAWGGQIEVNPTGGDFTGTLLPDTSASIIAFCVEPIEHIGYSTYTWQVSPLEQGNTVAGGMGSTRANQIRDLLYHVKPAFGIDLLSNSEALALQISLWEIVSEIDTGPYSLAGGNARFTSTGGSTSNSAVTLAQAWLNSYVNDATPGPYNNDLLALTRIGNQDLLVQQLPPPGTDTGGSVPAPASLWLLALPLWLLRRRARRVLH